jgi:hypothetical protein
VERFVARFCRGKAKRIPGKNTSLFKALNAHILKIEESLMPQAEIMRPSGPLSDRKDIQGANAPGIMTLHEKLALGVKAIELKKQGKLEEAMQIQKSISLSPYLAKWVKKRLGIDFLINQGYNLSEAEAE